MSFPHKHLVDSPIPTSKSLLAKLLALENVVVVRDPNISQAHYDPERKIIFLPPWKDMSDDLYSMLIVNQAGRVLLLPIIDLAQLCQGKYEFYRDIVEIVSDAFVNRKMQRKFPGTISNFREGVDDLWRRGFYAKGFEVPFEEKESLLNRFLLKTQVEPYIEMEIPFDEEEQDLLYGIEECDTFEDILKTSQEIYDHLLEHLDIPPVPPADQQEPDPSDGGEEKAPSMENGGGGSSYGGEGLGDLNRDLKEKMKDLSEQDPEEAEAEKQRQPPPDKDSIDIDELIDISEASSLPYIFHYQDSFFDLMEQVYRNFPEKAKVALGQELNEFTQRTHKVVHHMIQEFLQKKAARESFRTRLGKTGRIDVENLWKYRFDENIFKNTEIKKKGKSHGVLLFLDMSGSMSEIFLPSLLQVLNLVAFCQTSSIPFEVFGFSSNGPISATIPPENDYNAEFRPTIEKFFQLNICRILTLNNYFSSKMSAPEIMAATLSLYAYGRAVELFDKDGKVRETGLHTLGGTPLDACIVLTKDIFWRFKNENALDIVHSIYLTDGGNELPLFVRELKKVRFCRIKNGPLTYDYRGTILERTRVALEILRDETNSRVLSFFLTNNISRLGNSAEFVNLDKTEKRKAIESFKEDGYAEIPSSYDKMFIMNPTLLSLDEEADLSMQEKARPLLKSFIEEIAE